MLVSVLPTIRGGVWRNRFCDASVVFNEIKDGERVTSCVLAQRDSRCCYFERRPPAVAVLRKIAPALLGNVYFEENEVYINEKALASETICDGDG